MPVGDRDYVRGKHPPACTCKECTDRRLRKLTGRNSDDKTPPRIKQPFFSQTMGGKPLRLLWRKIPPSIHKLFLSLLVIAVLVDIVRRGYTLFTQQADPIKNTIVFLVEVGLWIWIVTILRNRRYRYRKPKFKLVLTAVIAITLVCAFAGIEPLSSYKDNLSNSISDYLEEQQTAREAAKVAEEEARVKAESEAERAAEEEAKARAEEEKQTVTDLSQFIYELVDEERVSHGLSSLQISPILTSLAEEHSAEMVSYDYFSHDRMPASRPFEWNLQPGFGRGENIFMMPERLLIPGPFLTTSQLANKVVQGWMDSPGHRQNILESRFTHTGIGIARKGEYYYITQMYEGRFVD